MIGSRLPVVVGACECSAQTFPASWPSGPQTRLVADGDTTQHLRDAKVPPPGWIKFEKLASKLVDQPSKKSKPKPALNLKIERKDGRIVGVSGKNAEYDLETLRLLADILRDMEDAEKETSVNFDFQTGDGKPSINLKARETQTGNSESPTGSEQKNR